MELLFQNRPNDLGLLALLLQTWPVTYAPEKLFWRQVWSLAGDLLMFFGGFWSFFVGWLVWVLGFFIWTSLGLNSCADFRAGRSAGSSPPLSLALGHPFSLQLQLRFFLIWHLIHANKLWFCGFCSFSLQFCIPFSSQGCHQSCVNNKLCGLCGLLSTSIKFWITKPAGAGRW